ncbi:MAG TPA: CaiB/BaiF CoA-transferase family protein [Chloroflexota bacterium]|nr:CaiB/BaiF CoA-transferase family protein [Chloroflexota bacterium]
MQETVSTKGQGSFRGPLVGVRVLDLGTVFAAPFTASLLGDFGADVIKVELPKIGDAVRGISPVVNGVPGPWTVLSRNKRCISLDVRKDKGKELLKKLVARADIVIENFRPGTLEKWGLGYDVLKQANPKLIMVRISGYGQTGPYSDKAGFGTPCTAFGGLTYMQGYPDRPPVSPPFPLADYVTGTFGAMSAIMALYHLKVNDEREGQQVDVALFETVFRMLETAIVQYDLTGMVRERAGHALQESAPAGAFQCKDGKWVILVTSTERTFARLAEVMGRTDLLKDPRYDTNPHRVQHRQEILALVQDWFSTQSFDQVRKLLDENGVPVSPIPSMADIFQDPQYKAREDLVQVEHPVLGKVTMPGIVPKFSATPGAVRFPGPVGVGEHNVDIYQGELGLSAEEFETLKAEEVI